MAETKTAVANVPIWLDLSSGDPAGSREFYGKLFGWHVEVNPDPQYGGYALGKLGGKDVAGIGPKQSPEGPSAWLVYVGTKNADDTVKKTKAAGGRVIVEPMQVGPQGRMVVIQDPAGAFIGAWEPGEMKGAQVMNVPNSFSWSELNARGIDKSIDFYNKVFGWSPKKSEMGGQGAGPLSIWRGAAAKGAPRATAVAKATRSGSTTVTATLAAPASAAPRSTVA